jgi:hypothetical protein
LSDGATDAIVRSFLPGDNIGMVVELAAPANLRTVKAMFQKEEPPQGVLVLSGNSTPVSELRDGRLNHAMLIKDEEWSTRPLPAGDYWLDEIRAETYLGKPLTIEYEGRLCLRYLSEPEETNASITKMDFLHFLE